MEANLTNRQMNNHEPVGQKNLKALITNSNNNALRKPIAKSNEQNLNKLTNLHSLNGITQYNTTNGSSNIKVDKTSNTNAVQTNSPLKLGVHFSNLTNNMTTNYTDNPKEQLTIKTNSLENESVVPSPSNIKTIVNNLKNISSKITPTNSTHKYFIFNDDNIKILEVNEDNGENHKILSSIQQFVSFLKSIITVNLTNLIEENNKKLQILNDVLKTMNFNYYKEESVKSDLKKPLHSTKNSKIPNFGPDLQKAVSNQENNKCSTSNKKKKKLGNKLFSPVSKSIKINFDLKLSNKNAHETHQNSSQASNKAVEIKVNSAKTREKIINEIYTNSDLRIKKYNTFLDFLMVNLKDIREIVIPSNKVETSNNNINDGKSNNMFPCTLNIEINSHQKKISPTSNDIEKLAKEIKEDKSLLFSSISILDSTLKKARLEELTCNKIIELSKNVTHNSAKADICDFNESEIQEYDPDELFKSPRYKTNNPMSNNGIRIILTRNDRKNDLNNLSKSLFISTLNSDFYKCFIDESGQNNQGNNISNEMSLLKGNNSGMFEILEQSAIYKKNCSQLISEDLEKTRENILKIKTNLIQFKKIDQDENLALKSLTLRSNKDFSHLNNREKIDDKILKNSDNNNLISSQAPQNQKDSKCIIY